MPHRGTIFQIGDTPPRGRSSARVDAMCDEAIVNDGGGLLPRFPVNRAVLSAAPQARASDLYFELVDDFGQYGAGRVGGACHLVPITARPREEAARR